MEHRNLTILVVDDSPVVVEVVARTLEREGFVVVRAIDGAQAILAAKRERPNLILMDITMPGMSGITACQIMRKDPDLDQTPIVLLTSEENAESIVRALTAGANDYILKSVSEKELVARIRRQLATHSEFRKQISAERLSAIGQIAFSLQHEIYNPLTSVIGFLEMSLRNTQLPGRTRRYLEMAHAEAFRIRELVERLSAVQDKPVNRFGVGQMIDLGEESAAD